MYEICNVVVLLEVKLKKPVVGCIQFRRVMSANCLQIAGHIVVLSFPN